MIKIILAPAGSLPFLLTLALLGLGVGGLESVLALAEPTQVA